MPSRRQVLQSALTVGVAAGAAVGLGAPAEAAPPVGGPAGRHASGEPLVAQLRDVRTGAIDVYVGTRHIRVQDRKLAALLAATAR